MGKNGKIFEKKNWRFFFGEKMVKRNGKIWDFFRGNFIFWKKKLGIFFGYFFGGKIGENFWDFFWENFLRGKLFCDFI